MQPDEEHISTAEEREKQKDQLALQRNVKNKKADAEEKVLRLSSIFMSFNLPKSELSQ